MLSNMLNDLAEAMKALEGKKIRCLPRPWNKAEKIAVVNSFSSMWLEINSALAVEGQRPSQVASPT